MSTGCQVYVVEKWSDLQDEGNLYRHYDGHPKYMIPLIYRAWIWANDEYFEHRVGMARITFNTILGELFSHNLKAQNYDWVEREFYALPPSAQLFFRRCLVHNDSPVLEFNLDTISQRINLTDPHQANRITSILDSALEPLRANGMIESFEQREGLSGPKFIVYRNFSKKNGNGRNN